MDQDRSPAPLVLAFTPEEYRKVLREGFIEEAQSLDVGEIVSCWNDVEYGYLVEGRWTSEFMDVYVEVMREWLDERYGPDVPRPLPAPRGSGHTHR